VSRTDRRRADDEARRLLRARPSAVFPAPVREALTAPTCAEANALSRELTGGRGLSRQSYALAPKILEVDPIALADERIFEVHPELLGMTTGFGPTVMV